MEPISLSRNDSESFRDRLVLFQERESEKLPVFRVQFSGRRKRIGFVSPWRFLFEHRTSNARHQTLKKRTMRRDAAATLRRTVGLALRFLGGELPPTLTAAPAGTMRHFDALSLRCQALTLRWQSLTLRWKSLTLRWKILTSRWKESAKIWCNFGIAGFLEILALRRQTIETVTTR